MEKKYFVSIEWEDRSYVFSKMYPSLDEALEFTLKEYKEGNHSDMSIAYVETEADDFSDIEDDIEFFVDVIPSIREYTGYDPLKSIRRQR